MCVWMLAAAILIAWSPTAGAQWTESCLAPDATSQDGPVCRCPPGTNKVRNAQRDLSNFQNTKGIRAYDCVRTAKAIKTMLIFFDFGQTNLPPSAGGLVDTVASIFKETGATSVELVGHTDTALAPPLSAEMSLARAVAVKAALVSKGIPAAAITARGDGKARLLVPTPDGTKEPQNRRVEVQLFK